MQEIKVGILASYDWEYLKTALPLVYPHADKICISIDVNRRTWSGNNFVIDEQAFQTFLKEIDSDHKINLYEDDFFLDKENPMKNEVYQRNKMAEVLKPGGWHVQIDADEYIPNFEQFKNALQKLDYRSNVTVNLPTLNIFKKVQDGFLLIRGNLEFFSIATNNPVYEHGRRSSNRNSYLNFLVLHQSYARNPEEIRQKLNNWGHKNDFDGEKFFDFWDSLTENNYREAKNFHPINPETWSFLEKVKASDIQELIAKNMHLKTSFKQRVEFFCLNSKIISKFVQVTGIRLWMFR